MSSAQPASWASSETARRTMLANRSKNTQPELAVRKILHAGGLRYRVNMRPIPLLRRTADVVFTRARVAVFIDGCFWHSCPEHSSRPKSNSDYWGPKLRGNVERDRQTDRALESAGWLVLRFWEHESEVEVAEAIALAVRAQHSSSLDASGVKD
ncbi:very short patch repair endonuclease [Microbacterium pygmaeum]|nr:very short patch repair endonuclease [Microbacterium pygmaeum]